MHIRETQQMPESARKHWKLSLRTICAAASATCSPIDIRLSAVRSTNQLGDIYE